MSSSTSLPKELVVRSPITNEVLHTLPCDTSNDIQRKVALATDAQKSWYSEHTLQQRLDILKQVAAAFSDATNQEKLAQLMTTETGRPLLISRMVIGMLPAHFQFWFDIAVQELSDEPIDVSPNFPSSAFKYVQRYEPVGSLLHIAPWNFPELVLVNTAVPALLAGNALIYKPSEIATHACTFLRDLFVQAGVPEDLLPLVVGNGHTGTYLLQRTNIHTLIFVGSMNTGFFIQQEASKRVPPIPCHSELGGKDGFYVCDDLSDKEIATAAESLAQGCFVHAGQSCDAVERIYVDEKIFDQFLQAFIEVTKNLPVGDPHDEKTFIGPLARHSQLAFLEEQVEDAVSKGAKIVYGTGKRRADLAPGWYFDPTILVDVTHDMNIMRDESFGPVIGIMKVTKEMHEWDKTNEQPRDTCVVNLINDSIFGLTGGIFTSDLPRALSFLSRLEVGTVHHNTCGINNERLAWSGRKCSGIGNGMLSKRVLRNVYTQPKSMVFAQNVSIEEVQKIEQEKKEEIEKKE